ncbi:CPBP family intramembrane glutamic endopeptidase [Aquibacillus kalidii]|uniref:CPBP family intramembrane glutamic endopeptidase n=1 Tax=Aquibacillus kalidii TaxID=2762597 RepID=UPI001645856E|nr:type II CAAX endopeptidase family protein [Aquibacillus kalidii]
MPRRYWYVILTYLLMQLSGGVVAPFIRKLPIDPTTAGVGWSLISFIGALIITLFLLRQDMKEGSVRGASNIGNTVLWSFLGIILAYMAQYVTIIIEVFILGIEPGSKNTMDIMSIARAAPIFIVIVSVIAPILEEIIFRKIIFGSIYKRTNFILAAIVSALIFALVHGDFTHTLTYMAMGIVFAFLYVQTKRIIVPIIAHMSMNTITVIAQLNMDEKKVNEMLEQLEKLQTILIGG